MFAKQLTLETLLASFRWLWFVDVCVTLLLGDLMTLIKSLGSSSDYWNKIGVGCLKIGDFIDPLLEWNLIVENVV